MAVTKIWAVTDSVSRVLSYAANPDKTIYSDICKALHYASDERKTVIGEEKAMYVTGVNCTAETAFAEMNAVQERFDKTVGNVAYHAYQSFKTGEVTPQLAHKLGVELAKRMWGDQYQELTLLDAINMNDCTPSHAQSVRLKKMSQDGLLTADAVYAVLSEEKPNQREQIKLPRDELRKYFPQNYSNEQIKRDIVKGLELLKRQRERNRDAR